MLDKTDFVLLKNDSFVSKGFGSYDNGAKVWRWSDAELRIGNYCSIAYGVNFIVDDGFHTCSEISSYPFINNQSKKKEHTLIRKTLYQKKGIVIGSDVWIGLNATILPGVKIGNGVTIAAGSVVSSDIPDYSVVGGVPAKIIKMKHSDEIIRKLKKIAWWEWPEEIIEQRIGDFYSPVDKFITKYLN